MVTCWDFKTTKEIICRRFLKRREHTLRASPQLQSLSDSSDCANMITEWMCHSIPVSLPIHLSISSITKTHITHHPLIFDVIPTCRKQGSAFTFRVHPSLVKLCRDLSICSITTYSMVVPRLRVAAAAVPALFASRRCKTQCGSLFQNKSDSLSVSSFLD